MIQLNWSAQLGKEGPGGLDALAEPLVRPEARLRFTAKRHLQAEDAIARQGLEFSPAGALMKAARQGGRAGAQQYHDGVALRRRRRGGRLRR